MTQASMTRYTGTKTLSARPMTHGEYNAYRGWTPPEVEDQTTAGYLVEYEDGGQANDSRHAGYISWSPADVFEKSYRPTGTFQDRVRLEKAELDTKIDALAKFLPTEIFGGLPTDEQDRMTAQLAAMQDYSGCLAERIAAFPA
ncbi:MAG: hypothetical protein YHS30scaffold667_6 [Phage 65_10]|nr:MAG: hypothetical protein YHS30scaffold667_6 [Phage 65_10]